MKLPGRGGRPSDGGSVQYAALPYRTEPAVEVLLVTSRDTGRWVLPKGWPMKRKAPHEAAAREAIEEAGVTGPVEADPLGSYRYDKRLANGAAIRCRVQVFPLRVEVERTRWREKHQRVRRWFPVQEAAGLVAEPELRALLHRFKPRD
jgi:8-oxo-dGTP pyrophosphatase MutT (NUDIX family)